MHGKWPDEMKDIRLKASEMSDGENITAVKMGKDGAIFAFLDTSFGDDKLVAYKPKVVMGGMNTRWECRSNLSTGVGYSQCKEDPDLKFDGKQIQ